MTRAPTHKRYPNFDPAYVGVTKFIRNRYRSCIGALYQYVAKINSNFVRGKEGGVGHLIDIGRPQKFPGSDPGGLVEYFMCDVML